MKYKVNDLIIKSENSAKPMSTASKYTIDILKDYINENDTILDYGCGKLRYAVHLAKLTKEIVCVDSKDQLDRKIIIENKKQSIKEYADKIKNISLYYNSDNEWRKKDFDKILLLHVISSVPEEKDRIKIIHDIFNIMNKDSIFIICTNHRMSYFKKWEKSDRVTKFNDGYLIKEPTPSYFGIINKDKIRNYLEDKFEIIKLFIKEDNTYCICKKKYENI